MKTTKIIFLVLSLIMLAFIWGQSLLPTTQSASESHWVTENIVNPVVTESGHSALTDTIVRKLAHIAEFAAFTFFVSLFFMKKWKGIGYSVFCGFTCAFLDETIQMFNDRGALISDVWIDMIGVAAGAVIGGIVTLIIIKIKGTKKI